MDAIMDKRADISSPFDGRVGDRPFIGGTLGALALDVLDVVLCAVAVPVAFTEGFLKAYLSIDRVIEHEDGCVTIIPHASAGLAEVISDADAILARVDGGAVFNPIVQSSLSSAARLAPAAMEWEMDDISAMDDDQLMDVLRAMQAASERERLTSPVERERATDYLRARLATIRLAMQDFVDRHEAAEGQLF